MKQGPDLSKWQGTINFDKLKAQADFVILRSSYGLNTKDARFYEYASEAKRVGIPVLGVYHFCYATNIQEAEKEALNCIEAVEKAGLDKNTILFYDLEYDSVETAKKKGVVINKSLCCTFTTAFCHKVLSKGYRAGVYFNRDYYKNMYNTTTLDMYIKWLADYKSTPTYECDVQQCTSTKTVPGISGNVDWNYLWNESLLIKEDKDTMTKEQFYEAFVDAMEEYRIRLRMKNPSPWSEEARKFCTEQGIFKGDGEGNMQWNDFLSREQAAQLIYNAYNKGLFDGKTEEFKNPSE